MKAVIESQTKNIFATSDFKHPLLSPVRFIFADNKPNSNNQGIDQAEFEGIRQSAIGMPIKMRFLGEAGAGGHSGAVTIGHIKDMVEEPAEEDGIYRLVAEGVLYNGEYPTEVAYLKEAYASGNAPGPSWELDYQESKLDGVVSWLKGVTTRAVAFVRNPAYGTRTALLALASSENISDEDMKTELLAIAKEISPKNISKGGSNKVTEEEIKKLQESLAAKIKEVETLTAERDTLLTAKAELETKVSEQDTAIAEINKAKAIAERTALAAEAGLKIEGDALVKKQEFWAGLSEDAFKEYLDDLKTASKVVPAPRVALAGAAPTLPRPTVTSGDEPLSAADLKAQFRSISRSANN